jgi:hypothetical protein
MGYTSKMKYVALSNKRKHQTLEASTTYEARIKYEYLYGKIEADESVTFHQWHKLPEGVTWRMVERVRNNTWLIQYDIEDIIAILRVVVKAQGEKE